MKKNIILGIETSCDDTSIALCIDGRIIANCTKSTINEHKKFGGIIPEIAARGHEQNIFSQYLKAMKLAKITFNELTKIAYTDRPGLPGSLHVGKIFAKSLGCLLKIPVVPIDHLLGHIYSFCIDKKEKIKYPFLGVVVSGGNTIIYLIKEYNKYLILNQTSDDAAGEALDKIGRFLGYQYPGGLWIDKNYDKKKNYLKISIQHKQENNFSFSGIKSYAYNLINKIGKENKILIGSSIFKWVIDDIKTKIIYYADKYKIINVRIGGGVCMSNTFKDEILKTKLNVKFPEKKYCNDNAAMIANLCYIGTI